LNSSILRKLSDLCYNFWKNAESWPQCCKSWGCSRIPKQNILGKIY